MAAEAPLYFALNVKERPDLARLGFNYAVTTPANDTIGFSYTINRHNFNDDAWKQLGARVEMDLGDGVLVTVPASERPASLSITGSLEGFGVRELTFGRIPSESPLRTAWMRAPRRVKVTGVRGTLGGYREWDLFDGLIRSGDHSMFPSAASLQAQDASVLNERLFYTLAPFSYRSRRSIIADICNRYGIKAGTWTFTDVANVGGYTMKGINELGERSVLEFLGEYLIPTTCRARWNGRALDIKHFTPAGTSKRTLTWSDIRELRVQPPPTNAANTVRFTSELYPYVGPDLTGTYETFTYTSAAYTTLVATHKQENTTGVISALALTGTALGTRTATRTLTTYAGGTITAQTIETYGAYAPKACNKKQNADGSTRYNEDFDVFLFADGTWRTVQEESWQVIRKTVLTRTFDANGRHQQDAVALWKFYDRFVAVAQYNAGLALIPVSSRYMKDDGTGWLNGKEQLQNDYTAYEFGAYDATTGKILSWTTSYAIVTATYDEMADVSNATPVNTKYKFGPSAAPVYGMAFAIGTVVVDQWRTDYSELTATSYRALKSALSIGHSFVQYPYYAPFETTSDDTVDEPIPLQEMTTATQVTQPASITTPSLVGAALVGKRMADYSESGWCETRLEMEAAGLQVLRQISAIRPQLTLHEVDFDLTEGEVLTLPYHPDLGDGPTQALIVSAQVDLDGQGCSGEQRLELEIWLPEVA